MSTLPAPAERSLLPILPVLDERSTKLALENAVGGTSTVELAGPARPRPSSRMAQAADSDLRRDGDSRGT